MSKKIDYSTTISGAADKIESKVIAWRHGIHEHPELGNREVRTAALIAKHLQSLGIEVKTGVGVNRCSRNFKRRQTRTSNSPSR